MLDQKNYILIKNWSMVKVITILIKSRVTGLEENGNIVYGFCKGKIRTVRITEKGSNVNERKC